MAQRRSRDHGKVLQVIWRTLKLSFEKRLSLTLVRVEIEFVVQRIKCFIIFCLVEKLRYAKSATRVLSRNNIHLNIIAKPMTERVLVVITLGLFTHKCHLSLIGIAS